LGDDGQEVVGQQRGEPVRCLEWWKVPQSQPRVRSPIRFLRCLNLIHSARRLRENNAAALVSGNALDDQAFRAFSVESQTGNEENLTRQANDPGALPR